MTTSLNGVQKHEGTSNERSRHRLIMLNKLTHGGTAYGTFLMLSSAWTSRIVAQAGWDYVIVDCEHGNIGDSDMHDSVNAIASSGVSPIVRVRGTDPTLIKRALDTGAHGLMIPMVNTAEQAREVVKAAKFPPMGVRGQGSPFSSAAHGLSTPEYLQSANEDLLTIIQIESQEGLTNVEEICQVSGVDAIFIGPNDLAMSLLNYAPPKWDERPFVAALAKIHAAARKHGKYVGILYADGAQARQAQELVSYDIVGVGGDVKALNGWMCSQLQMARSAPSSGTINAIDAYERIELSVPDTMFALVARYNADSSPLKVNLAPGTYRDPDGKPWVLPSFKKAADLVLNAPAYNHEYLAIQGNSTYLKLAAELVFGSSLSSIASLQTVGGTGACHMGAVFLKQLYERQHTPLQVFISDPSWENHINVFRHAGLQTRSYPIYDDQKKGLDFMSMKAGIARAPRGSIVVLHACAHNPTGCDPSPEQWDELARIFNRCGLIAFFDNAYQGYASGDLEEDRYSIETFHRHGVQLLVAQSFSKNAGMYGERLGALHIPCPSPQAAERVVDLLKAVNRREVSTPPRFAADLLTVVMNSVELYEEWKRDIATMASRLRNMRTKLVAKLRDLQTPGDWTHILDQRGMFSYTGLKAAQTRYLTDKCHIYLPPSGRLSVTGLTEHNLSYVATAIDYAVRNI